MRLIDSLTIPAIGLLGATANVNAEQEQTAF